DRLAISDDGAYLYVGVDADYGVKRVNLVSRQPDLQFRLDPSLQLRADHIQVIPGNPRTVAISRLYPTDSSPHRGVALYDDGVKRPLEISADKGSDLIQASSGSRMYGCTTSLIDRLYRISVTASGLEALDSSDHTCGADMKIEGGLIYTAYGEVI